MGAGIPPVSASDVVYIDSEACVMYVFNVQTDERTPRSSEMCQTVANGPGEGSKEPHRRSC